MEEREQRIRVAEEAARWWVAMQDNPSRAERIAYVAWLRESPLHVAEMLRLCQLYVKLGRFSGWASISGENVAAHCARMLDVPSHRSAGARRLRALICASGARKLIWVVGALAVATLIALLHRV